MKKILIATALIVLAALIYPIIGSQRSDEGMSREASNIRQLLICVVHYTKEKNEFPETIQSAMKFSQLDEREFSEFTADPNFSYMMPESSPQETDPYTIIIEFKMNEGTYKGYYSGHAEFFEQPKS